MSTVQAPQWLVSQPICALEPQLLAQEMDQQRARLDQRLDLAAVHGQLDDLLGHGLLLNGAGERPAQRALGHHAGKVAPVIHGTAHVGHRVAGGLGRGTGGSDGRIIDGGAVDEPGLNQNRRLAEIGQRHRGMRAAAAGSEDQDRGGGGGRIVADLALLLLVGPAVAGGRNRDADAIRISSAASAGSRPPR